RCRGRPARRGRDATRASSPRASACRGRRRTTARPRHRRSARADTAAPTLHRQVDLLSVVGDLYIPSELFRNAHLERILRDYFTMNQVRCLRRARKCAQPPDDLARISMRRHALNLLYSRVDRDVLPEDLHVLRTVLELAAPGAGRLEADEEHGIARIRQTRKQMVHDAAARGHAA